MRTDSGRSTADGSPGIPDSLLFESMVRVADLISRKVSAALTEDELSLSQYHLLRILSRVPHARLETTEAARRVPSHAPNVTRLVDRLEARGLLRRQRCDEDRRVVWVSLTEAGTNLLRRLSGAVEAAAGDALGPLGTQDRRLLSELLNQLQMSLDTEHGTSGWIDDPCGAEPSRRT
ncbi:MAG: MarR family transcriptional regulator [Candidatus Eisenbacteria bacterium]|uniref:MarR family transcriptional regulator n=1 Tax=Eiseniibacteriota bacterium TaxID=2212470 RepID=A0A956M039_UNCEI|nr:MarR family transcriptional regulator [Candidatus Eisenbacteria bacterium]